MVKVVLIRESQRQFFWPMSFIEAVLFDVNYQRSGYTVKGTELEKE